MAATANIRAVISAQDNASKVVSQFGNNVAKSTGKITKSNDNVNSSFNRIVASTLIMGTASKKLLGVIDESVEAANKYQNALLGLDSISKAFGVDAIKAKEAAESLAKDGLLTVADSARGLKNLLQSGFSLPQAVKLMERFKDSAAFGKQAALTFGDAVASATEGIKNGNSILVDNAGVTKNLSRILEEAGFSAQDLMRATTDASVRQALFKGIVKETNAQVGDAAKLADSFAGEQAKLGAQTTILKQQIGAALQPALAKILETITPIIEKFAKFTQQHPGLVSGILLITTAVTGLIAVLGALGLAISGIAPLFKAMSVAGVASIRVLTVAFKGLSLLITTKLVVPALVIGAAIASINAIKDAWNAVNNAKRAAASLDASNIIVRSKLEKLARDGTPAQRKRAQKQLDAGVGLAGGTDNWQGGLTWVGERGKELVSLPKGSQVTPNHELKNLGGQQTFNITIQAGAFMGNQMEARKYAVQIVEAYKDAMGMRGKNGVFA